MGQGSFTVDKDTGKRKYYEGLEKRAALVSSVWSSDRRAWNRRKGQKTSNGHSGGVAE